MSDFKWRHFAGGIILHGVRWYCKYGISYRDLEEMLEERGIAVDHTTLYRWVQKYAPEIEKRLRWHRRGHELNGSWRVDETYVKVKGEWKYLYRAVSADGDTIDFYLSHTRSISAATIFLKKALRATAASQPPASITTDKNPTYRAAIVRTNAERALEPPVQHRDVKYLNNVIEADHGKLKRLIKPTLGFKTMKSAYATVKGFEVMRMFRKGQFACWYPDEGVMGEVRLINRQFGIYGA
jgi:transposase-like protein